MFLLYYEFKKACNWITEINCLYNIRNISNKKYFGRKNENVKAKKEKRKKIN